MIARTVMVQGTASSVGKSLLVTGLCRLLHRAGLRVAPFKAQNMALNASVTALGGEIGRAQAVQAEAACVEASVDMNPILLKPEGDARSQVVLLGKPLGAMGAREYHEHKPELRRIVAECLGRLREVYDVVVIEGAGSPAEINLRDRDLVNMHVAHAADAPVLLAGDIDRGGVFAALVGTMELLEPQDRARVAAFVINKFRGDVSLLTPGLDFLERRTGVPVLGVVPYVPRLRIADEDSVSLDSRRGRRRATGDELDVVVVGLPRISNFDDFEPLEHEPGVVVRFVDRPEDVDRADLVVVPGTKSTIADLRWLGESGIAEAIVARARRGEAVIGICGGCQMLGGRIDDPDGVEAGGASSAEGLALLPLATRFERTKTTARAVARLAADSGAFFAAEMAADARLDGYEIHMGRVHGDGAGAFRVIERGGRSTDTPDGAVGCGGSVVGTMLHGLFENDALRVAVLRSLRRRRGLPEPASGARLPTKHAEYDRMAAVLRESLDLARLERIIGVKLGGV
jgi:adenosylcobyric acid synthase